MAEHFPTEFAKSVLIKVDLYSPVPMFDIEDEDEQMLAIQQHNMIKQFQQIAVFNELDKALVIYDDVELTEQQSEALKLIHEITPMQMSGIATESLIDVIVAKTHKDYAKIAELFFGQLSNGDNDSMNQGASPFVVNTFINGEKQE